MKRRLGSVLAVICILSLLLNVFPAHAGCGCEKPIPPPAQIIPKVTYPGTYIRIYHDAFEVGEKYKIEFESEDFKPKVICDIDRDGRVRLKVLIPEQFKRIGPTLIKVKRDSETVLKIPKENFTLAPKAIPIPHQAGTYYVDIYRAAIDYDGIVYVAVDLSEVTDPVTVVGTLLDFPLWMDPEDVFILNSQGFIMTELGKYELPIPVPGMDVIYEWNDPQRSDSLIYWRHEFNTYYAQHEEKECHFIDPEDPDYHLDGTPHIDHNQLIFAIAGQMADGKLPGDPGHTTDIQLSIGIFYDDLGALDFVDNPPKNYDMILDFEEYNEKGPPASWSAGVSLESDE